MSTEVNKNCSCKQSSLSTNHCTSCSEDNEFKNCTCKKEHLSMNHCASYPEPEKNCSCKQNHLLMDHCPSCPEPVDNEFIAFSGLCNTGGFNLSIANNWTELTINGSVLVPEVKPCIEQVEGINAKIEIIRSKVIATPDSLNITNFEGRKVTGTKLIVEGLICLSISYVSKKIDQSLHSFHGKIPFSAYIVLPTGTALTAPFHVSACIEDIIVKQVCDRKINLTTTFVLQAIPLTGTAGEDCFEDCDMLPSEKLTCECDSGTPEIKGLCTPTDVALGGERRWTEIFIPEILNIPCYKPPVEQILSVTSKVEIFCQKVISTPTRAINNEGLTLTGNKLVIEGMLKQKVVYVAKTETQSVHAVHFDVPISTFIVLDTADTLTDKFKLFPCIEDIFICILNEKQIFKNTTLFIKATKLDCTP